MFWIAEFIKPSITIESMFEELAQNLVLIKQDFAKDYAGNAHIQEVIPTSTRRFQMDANHLQSLHDFAEKNPIYTNSYEQEISGIPCMVYEGDINEYWLNSIKHGSNYQPFYPTWIMSAYILAYTAQNLGYRELVDIGSGDGRIAFCGSLTGMTSHSIEIDDVLVDLQRKISESTGLDFNSQCCDASEFDYSKLCLRRPVFFIGGLAQMGGDILATSIIENITLVLGLMDSAGLVLAGTNSKRHLSVNIDKSGWGTLLDRHGLDVTDTVLLPTMWTFDQTVETPYLFAKFRQHGKNRSYP